MKTYGECCHEVAVKYKLGKTLVTGHLAKYWTEAAEMYADQYKKQLTEMKDYMNCFPFLKD